MKAYEFLAQVNAQGIIELPLTILHKIQKNQQMKVIIIVDDKSEDEFDKAWRRLASEQLLKGYSASDAIYDII